MNYRTLSDERIILRPFTLKDLPAHLTGQDDEQARWLGGKGTEETGRRAISRWQEYWDNDGPVFNFAICDHTGNLLGMVESNIDYTSFHGGFPSSANISYALYPQARGQGIASRAVRLMESFLRKRGIHYAVIRVHPDNNASLNVARRLEYHEQGSITTHEDETLIVFIKELFCTNACM